MGYLNLPGTELAEELQGAPHPGHHAVLPGVRAGPAHIGQEVQHGGHGLRGLGLLLPLLLPPPLAPHHHADQPVTREQDSAEYLKEN